MFNEDDRSCSYARSEENKPNRQIIDLCIYACEQIAANQPTRQLSLIVGLCPCREVLVSSVFVSPQAPGSTVVPAWLRAALQILHCIHDIAATIRVANV